MTPARARWRLLSTPGLLLLLLLAAAHAHRAAAAFADVCAPPFPAVPFDWRPADPSTIALTFDDGPHPAGLRAVLDVLARHGVPATFFVNTPGTDSPWLGPFSAPSTQALLRRALAEGHELGSHAAQHVALPELPSRDAVRRQLIWAMRNISSLTGSPLVPLFRAPYGALAPAAEPSPATRELELQLRLHHVHISWQFSGNDYQLGALPNCSDALVGAYTRTPVSGLVLMHSTAPNAMGGCPAALDRILAAWKAAGKRFVKASDVVREVYGLSPEQVVLRSRQCPAPAPAARSLHTRRRPPPAASP